MGFSRRIKCKLALETFLGTIGLPIVWILLLIAYPFKKESKHIPLHYPEPNGNRCKRYRLPKWAFFLETPDEALPGGLYEPTVLGWFQKHGPTYTGLRWLGLRNVCHGIMWSDGFEVPKHINAMTEEEMKAAGIWQVIKPIGPFNLIYGYKTVHDWYGLISGREDHDPATVAKIAVPRITVRLKSQKQK